MSNATATATKPTAPKVDADSVNWTNNTEARAALASFVEAKAAIKAYEDQKATAEKVLRTHLKGKRNAIIRGIIALKVSSLRTRGGIDAKALLAAYPEAHAATYTETTYDFLIPS
jgi:predicted negative regulator of RcsB-dependent stress response